MINVMWALTEFTAENGATHVVPGSHLWLGDRLPEPHEIESAEMSKGSALIYLGSTVHGGGANASDSARLGLTVSYCLGWLRQAENQYLTYPPEVAADFPPALQALIGYSVHRPNVGLVNNRDPIETILPCQESLAPPIDYLTEDQIRLAQEVA